MHEVNRQHLAAGQAMEGASGSRCGLLCRSAASWQRGDEWAQRSRLVGPERGAEARHLRYRFVNARILGVAGVTDRVSREDRSRMMAAVHGADTAPELHLRRELFAAGFRFRLHVAGLPGRPDIVLPRYRMAVFVHGCFWHGHTCPRGKRPASNTTFWNAKLDANIRRDKRDRAALKSAGWRSVVIWQCELEKASRRLVRRLRAERAAAAAPGSGPSL